MNRQTNTNAYSQKIILANIITMQENTPIAEAVLVNGQTIFAVGTLTELQTIAPKAEILNHKTRWLTPGLTDAHIHLVALGFALQQIQLETTNSETEAALKIAAQAKELPQGTWIVGGGFDQNRWGDTYPSKESLDALIPHHPVVMSSRSGHSIWVNSLALKLANISTSSQDPTGGAILRNENGEPSGTLLEEPAIALIENIVPAPSFEMVLNAARIASLHMRKLGFTAVHTMALEPRSYLEAMQTLANNNEMPLRIYACVPHAQLEQIEALGLHGHNGGRVSISGIKFFTDGAIGAHTAWMFEPYNNSEQTGIMIDSPETILQRGTRALELGFDVVAHAIGDQANHEVLNVFEKLAPIAKTKGLRLRLEHAQHLQPNDIGRIAKLGVVASMQSVHIPGDANTIEKLLGKTRAETSFALRSILHAGAVLALGSDAPVATPDPVKGLEAAVLRQDDFGKPWQSDEAISASEALEAYTLGAAKAAGWQHWYGKIAPGYVADFTLWETNPLDGNFKPLKALSFD